MAASRWSLRLTGIILLFLLCCGSVVAALSAEPDHITLTWLGDPRTNQTITWRTDVSAMVGLVRIWEAGSVTAGSAPLLVLPATTRLLATDDADMNLHTVTVSGLKPATLYQYQVGGGDAWAGPYSFKTAPLKAEPFSFVIFGDSQSLDYNVWRRTMLQAYRDNPAAAFFISMGDLVDVGQDYAEWEAWFAATAGVMESWPILPVVGNHECYTPERVFSRPRYFTAQFSVPENGPAGLERQVYSFDYGEVHFVVLDSQAGEQKQFLPDLLERQRQWLAQDLAGTDRKWKVALIHRPLFGNKPQGVNEQLRQVFAPLFDEYKVDVVFTAHDHVIARTVPINADAETAPPGAGTIHAATGRSGTKTYQNVEAKEWNVFFENPADEPNYLVVAVTGNALQVRAISVSGSVVDEWAAEKTVPKTTE